MCNHNALGFFEVRPDDVRYPDAWFLTHPHTEGGEKLDSREFRYGKPYNGPLPASIPIGRDGRRVAFHFGAFDMPVVRTEVADILEQVGLGDIERFPVSVGNGVSGYEIVNAIHQRKCVDEERSGVRKWGLRDGRPDKIGHYHAIQHLVIDPTRTEGSHIFRLWGSLVELIVSETVMQALVTIDDLGVVFCPCAAKDQ